MKEPRTLSPLDAAPLGASKALSDWRKRWKSRKAAILAEPRALNLYVPQAWDQSEARLRSFLERGESDAGPPSLAELSVAAAGIMPSAGLGRHLDRLTAADWSAFALDVLLGSEGRTMHWAFLAALRALGFSSRLLQALADVSPSDSPVHAPQMGDKAWVLDFDRNSPPGYLLIGDGLVGAFVAPSAEIPIFVVPRDFSPWADALDRLGRHGAFARIVDDEEE